MKGSTFLRVLLAFIAVALGAPLSMATAPSLPSAQVGSESTPVTPQAALSYYQGVGLTSLPRSGDPDPDIISLAAALRNDPDLIYSFVRDEIAVTYLFGLQKGARGAAIDKAGTPFDQAHLMVELLRASGIPASYEYGTVTLTGQQFSDWFGVSNAQAAQKILASGGFPAVVTANGSAITSVVMSHIWVRATIGGTEFVFDPAYKPHNFKTGINLNTAMGFNGSTFVTQALVNATSNSTGGIHKLRNANETNVWNNLGTYATNLLNHLRNNMPDAAMDDVIGGQTIIRHGEAPLRQATLPYPAAVSATFANDIPNVLRTTIRLQQNFDETLFVDEIYGKVLLWYQLGGASSLELDDEIIASYTPPTPGEPVGGMPVQSVIMQITVNHPYAAQSGAYMDAVSLIPSPPDYMNVIAYGFGDTGPELGAKVAQWMGESYYRRQWNCVDQPVGPSICRAEYTSVNDTLAANAWTAFLSQYTRMAEIYGRMSGTLHQHHHSIGVVGTMWLRRLDYTQSMAGSSLKLNIETGLSLESKTGDANTRRAALAALVSGMNTLEGSVAEQTTGSIYPSSVAAKLDWVSRMSLGSSGGTNVDWVYYANVSNWNSIKNLLLADRGAEKLVLDQADAYIAAGYTLVIPRSSNLGPGPNQTETNKVHIGYGPGGDPQYSYTYEPSLERGGVIIAYKPDDGNIAYVTVRNDSADKGGGGATPIELDPGKIFSPSENFLEQQFETRRDSYSIDLQTGTLTYTAPPDLVVGNGEFPYSLSFQRSFRAGIGGGWSHNWESGLSISGNTLAAMGELSPLAAAEMLVAFHTQLYLNPRAQTADLDKLRRHMIAALVDMWWSQKAAANTVTMNLGPQEWSFTRLADSTYLAPSGDASTLTGSVTRSFQGTGANGTGVGNASGWITPPNNLAPRDDTAGTVKMFPISCLGMGDMSQYRFTLTTKSRDVLTFDYYCNSEGEPFESQLAYAGYRLTSYTTPYGMSVNLTYSNILAVTQVTNSLGRVLAIDESQPGSGMGVYDMSDPENPRSVGIDGWFCDAATDHLPSPEQCQGTITSVTDTLGNKTRYEYVTPDPAAQSDILIWLTGGRRQPLYLASVFFPTDTHTPGLHFDYDHLGRVSSLTDGMGNVWNYLIAAGRRGGVVDPMGAYSATRYDENGLAVESIDAHGFRARTEYDAHRRPFRSTDAEGAVSTQTYDARHNVIATSVAPKPGSLLAPIATSATYHATCNTPLTETDALGRVTTYAYDAATCRMISMTGPALAFSSF